MDIRFNGELIKRFASLVELQDLMDRKIFKLS